jgi:hypothetical protein
MDVPNWLIVLGVIAALSLVAGAACLAVVCYMPPLEEGNRPLPPSVLAANEQARHAAIARINARAEAWRQYDARRKGQDR